MKKFAALSLLAFLLCGYTGLAYAQADAVQPDPVAAPAAVPAADDPAVPAEEGTTWEQLVDAFKLIISDWRTYGVLGGLAAIASFLVLLLKLTFIEAWLKEHNLTWLKALLAAVFAGLAAMFSALVAGADWTVAIQAFIAGLAGVGTMAVGGHEIVKGAAGLKKK